eukprot:2210628-Rhodomonas_salina.1
MHHTGVVLSGGRAVPEHNGLNPPKTRPVEVEHVNCVVFRGQRRYNTRENSAEHQDESIPNPDARVPCSA